MTHDKIQEAAGKAQDAVQKVQDNVQHAKDTVKGAKETYQQAVDSGMQNVSGGEDIVLQLVDTAIASGVLERIGAEYGATGAAVVAVAVGLYWTWRKKSGGISNEIQEQKEEEVREVLPTEEPEKKEEQKEEELETPQDEVNKLKSLEEKTEEGGIVKDGENK